MYVLLPPSETKTVGGSSPAGPAELPFPGLSDTRARVRSALMSVSADPVAARTALKVSAGLDPEVAANLLLDKAPTMPALDRYTGVLYAAFHDSPLTRAERARADSRVLITSALFGLVTAGTPIPAYRVSAGSRLPGLGGLATEWKPSYSSVLAELDSPVVDLRSGAYAAFGGVPGSISVRVVTAGTDGIRKAVSHDNKATKGAFARLLATSRAELGDVAGVLRVARRAGWTVERTGPAALDLLI